TDMRCLRVGALLLLVVVAGCSAPRSRVHGVVRYKGKPLEGATIIFLAPDNRTYPARVRADGSYDMPAVGRGHILVAIQTPPVRPRPRANPGAGPAATKARDTLARDKAQSDDAAKGGAPRPQDAPTGVTIPAFYADPKRSGLAFDLNDPDQEY